MRIEKRTKVDSKIMSKTTVRLEKSAIRISYTIALFCFIGFLQLAVAQETSKFGTAVYGGTDIFTAKELSDGGYLLAGDKTFSTGYLPIFGRADRAGKVQWLRKVKLDGLSGYFSMGIETHDGAFVFAGDIVSGDVTTGSDLDLDPLIVKTDKAGKVLWGKRIHGQWNDTVWFLMETSDGGYLAVGNTLSFQIEGGGDAWVFKLDKSGHLLWSKVFAREGSDALFSAVETNKGDYVLVGNVDIQCSNPSGECDKGFVLKLSRDAKVKWQRLYTVPKSSFIGLYSIASGPNRTFYVFGQYSPGLATPGSVILRLDDKGKIVWKNNYYASDQSYFSTLAPTPEGDLIAAGSMYRYSTEVGVLAKIAANGKLVWSRKTQLWFAFNDVSVDQEGSITALALSKRNFLFGEFFSVIFKADSMGQSVCKSLNASQMKIRPAQITAQIPEIHNAEVYPEVMSPKIVSAYTSFHQIDFCDVEIPPK